MNDQASFEKELGLFPAKWFDYQILTPAQASEVFLFHYAKARQTYHDVFEGRRFVNFLKGFDVREPQAWKHWGAITKARQFADSLGIPYPVFMNLALEVMKGSRLRHFDPNVFMTGIMQDRLIELWNDYRQTFLVESELDLFRAAQYRGLWIQRAYYFYVLREVRRRHPERIREVLKEMIEAGKLPMAFLRSIL